MPEASVDSIVTDPPYGLSFMGKDWDHGVPGVHFWKEALRVAKPGAHLLAFGGTRTFHRLAVAIEDAGWEIRDTLMWVYGSGFPKSHDVSKAIDRDEAAHYANNSTADLEPTTEAAKQWQGWGTALKPAWEPIIMARKPLAGTVAQNVLAHGTGAINVDGCRVATAGPDDEKKTARPNCAGKVYGVIPGGETFLTGEIKSQCSGHDISQGRWPANVIHDGSEEVVRMFPDQTSPGPYIRASTDQNKAQMPGHKAGEWNMGRGDTGSAARFFYCAKASKADRDEGLSGFNEAHKAAADFRPNHGEKAAQGEDGNPYGRWNKVRNNHPTVKPTDLMRYLCRLVTPPKGIVFDPFMGSGSTGKASILEGFSFIGCDLQEEYVKIARARIEHAQKLRREELGLFAEIEDAA